LENIDNEYWTYRIKTVALSNINMEMEEGEFISIMGPSGSGKSTLLNIMGLLDAPSKGQIHLNGQAVTSYADKYLSKIRNEQIGFIFQSFHLIPDLSVVDNVEIPLLYRRMSGKQRRELSLAALDRASLSARIHHFPSELSGGQQQRVAIARATVGKPRLLPADEPTGNLDVKMGDEIMDILRSLNTEEKTTIAMVTHDPRLAEETQRTIRLFDGRQVQ
jgi:putative ABC transport system ATP-binding protein